MQHSGGLRWRLLPLLLALALLLLAPEPAPRSGGRRRRPASAQRAAARALAARARTPPPLPLPPAPCLVWTLIYGGAHLAATRGSVNYQYYLPESIRQARIFNPGVEFFLLTDDAERLHAERPAWRSLLAQGHLNATVVDVQLLRDWELIHVEERMRDVWGPLAHNLGSMMMPSLAGGTNMAFTTVTLTRLVYLHHWLRSRGGGGGGVVHLENDQMLYGHVGEVAGPAGACGVELALGRVAPGRYAAAVLYLSGAPPLRRLLDFLVAALSHGWQHAAAVAESFWVTDMSLAAAFVAQERGAGRGASIATFPAPQEAAALRAAGRDCLAARMGVLVDAAALGIWCCGDMGRGREWLRVRTEYAESEALFEAPFEWRAGRVEGGAAAGGGGAPVVRVPVGLGGGGSGGEVALAVRLPRQQRRRAARQGAAAAAGEGAQWVSVGGGEEEEEEEEAGEGGGAGAARGGVASLRFPTWNGTRLFSVHLSSKMLHWWRSDDAEPPLLDPDFAGEVGDMV